VSGIPQNPEFLFASSVEAGVLAVTGMNELNVFEEIETQWVVS
jgi:hypothetical protein